MVFAPLPSFSSLVLDVLATDGIAADEKGVEIARSSRKFDLRRVLIE